MAKWEHCWAIQWFSVEKNALQQLRYDSAEEGKAKFKEIRKREPTAEFMEQYILKP